MFGYGGQFPCHCAGGAGAGRCDAYTGDCAVGCYTDSNVYGAHKLGDWKGPACQIGM